MALPLSESDWKKLLKEHDAASDAGVSEALREYAKSQASKDFAAQLEALNAVVAKAEATKKKNAKLKPVVSHLDDLIKEANKAIKPLEKELEEKEEEGEDEEVVDLGKHLLLGLKIAKQKGFFAVMLGKPSRLLIKKKKVPKPDLALLKKVTGGGKIFRGLATKGDAPKEYVFDLLKVKPPAGLAKKLVKTVKDQCGKTIKVIVAGGGSRVADHEDAEEMSEADLREDPRDLEDDDTEDADTTPEDRETPPSAPPPPPNRSAESLADSPEDAPATEVPPPPPPEPPSRADEQQTAWRERLHKLEPDFKERLKANAPNSDLLKKLYLETRKHVESGAKNAAAFLDKLEQMLEEPPPPPPPPELGDAARWKALKQRMTPLFKTALQGEDAALKTLLAKAIPQGETFEKAKQFAQAIDLYEKLDARLQGTVPPPPPGPPPPPPPPPPPSAPGPQVKVAPARGKKIQFIQARLNWHNSQRIMQDRLNKLQSAIVNDYPEEADLAQDLAVALDLFDTRLQAALDSAVAAKTPEARLQLRDEALQLIREYRTELNSNDLIKHIDSNPLVATDMAGLLGGVLSEIETTLKAVEE